LPQKMHNFTNQIMSFDKACDLVKTAHKIEPLALQIMENP